jgi:hypothetical protein
LHAPGLHKQTPLIPILFNRVAAFMRSVLVPFLRLKIFLYATNHSQTEGEATMLQRMRLILPVFTLLTSLFTIQTVHASTIQLPQTGQTFCFDTTTNATTDCANTTGQDGNILAGKPWPNPRFTVNMQGDGITPDGTFTDNLTGLIWLSNAACFDTVGGISKGQTGVGSFITWPNALTWSNKLKNGDCGLADNSLAGDWRLPNITELQSLVTAHGLPSLPSDNPASFYLMSMNQTILYFWSSSTSALLNDTAWYVYFYGGSVNVDNKYNVHYVWPVRAGQ